MALKKLDIVEQIQAQLGFPRNRSLELVKSILEIIKSSLEAGDDVLVSGFGKFCVREKGARRGRNPATDEPMMLNPRRVVTFRCSGKLKNILNQT